MKQENNYQRKRNTKIDVPYLLRCIWKNTLVIILCACIIGAISYWVLISCMKNSYVASVDLAVIARGNSSGNLSQYNMESAVIRSQNILNSDTLKEQIAKTPSLKWHTGVITAERVTNSNIITLKTVSSSMESAFRLPKAALEQYPSLSNYFDINYMLVEINNLTAESIVPMEININTYVSLVVIAVLLVGIGIVACMSIYTNKIHNSDQAKHELDMDMFGSLSYIKKRKEQKAILMNSMDIKSFYIEEIDKIATRIQDRMDEKKYKTLMVTSIRENDGKSTVAVNIALSLAQRGKKVMLIDCDLRRPSVFKIFERSVDNKKQLSSYLLGKVGFQEVLTTDENIKNIDFVFQKIEVKNVENLLNSEKIDKFFQQALLQDEYIILDTPPIGVVRDAEVIAEVCNAVLLVLRQDQERVSEINDAIDILEDTGTEVIGGILNMVKEKSSFESQNYRYSKYYT